MNKGKCIAMLLAGGQGSRLGPLTRNIAKPAVSFYGKYRIVDFSLSNCANSHINTVGVLTQYKPFFLNKYIGKGSAWNLDDRDGLYILPPYLGENEASWYRGTANAVYQNLDFIDYCNPDYVLIISGDHIYKMDYNQMLEFHRKKKAQITLSVIEVAWQEASRFGLVTADQEQRIRRFMEKPLWPESNLASMGVYIFDWPVLKQALIEDEQDLQSQYDFGKNIIPKQLALGSRIFAYQFRGYWRDVGTIESYYHTNLEYLSEDLIRNFEHNARIFSNEDIQPPHYVGTTARIENSLVSDGCTVLGTVRNSILGPGVYIGKGTEIRDSILSPYARIHNSTVIKKTIIGEKTEIGNSCMVGAACVFGKVPDQEGITVIEDHHKIPDGTVIEAGKNIYRDREWYEERVKQCNVQ